MASLLGLPKLDPTSTLQPEQIELKGFNRTLAEIEWLLLILIIAYLAMVDVAVDTLSLALACVSFGAFVIGFRYLNLFTLDARWKLALETWAMIALTAFAVWNTGKFDSPLINLYLLPIVFAALTLGKVTTLLQVMLITALYLHASHAALQDAFFTFATFGDVLFKFAPFVLIAYLTSLLAADMVFARTFTQRLSETDELTNLPNMRAFNSALQRQQAQAEHRHERFAVVMIDADELKPINDQFGHEVGNKLLRALAAAMQPALRDTDLLARYGGDEFVVLLPNTGAEGAQRVADRLLQSVANMTFDVNGNRIGTTVSIGYAVYPDCTTDVEALLEHADRAMYASKQAGRNRVTQGEPD